VIFVTLQDFCGIVSLKNQFSCCLSQFHFRGAVTMMKSPVVKRSIVVGGRKTSVSLEDIFWEALREIARKRGVTVSGLVGSIDLQREHYNLSSAIRVFVFDWHRHQHHEAETDELSEPVQAASAHLAA
jgi:predicted DNA-binding ribbon-helix-helix protein